MAPRPKALPAPDGFSWNQFLKTYRKKNADNYPRTRAGNKRLMRSAGKAWALFKEQAAAAFVVLNYIDGDDKEDEMDVAMDEVTAKK